ncbi:MULTISPECIES: hypothetical protein [unclassified Okeania]|nr:MULTISPECIES: hypothetical protein [unclassified Okeania]
MTRELLLDDFISLLSRKIDIAEERRKKEKGRRKSISLSEF